TSEGSDGEVSNTASVAIQTPIFRSNYEQSLDLAHPGMDSMFKELEASVMESLKEVEEINKQLKAERLKKERDAETAFLPELLKGDGSVAMGKALAQLQQRLFSRLPSDRVSSPAAVSAAVTAWLSSDSRPASVCQLARQCRLEVCAWLNKLIFNIEDSFELFHLHLGDEWDSIRLACQRALVRAYSGSGNDLNHQAMLQRHPLIYLHPSTPDSIVEPLAVQLCLPLSAFRRNLPGSSLSPETLAEALDADFVTNRPVLVQAVCGQDQLVSLVEVCRSRGVWLHAQGSRLADDAALATLSSDCRPDSACLDFSQLFGLFGLPKITWIAGGGAAAEQAELESDETDRDSYDEGQDAELGLWLPAWLALQHIGSDSAADRPTRVRACRLEFANLLKRQQQESPELIMVPSRDPTEILFRFNSNRTVDDADGSWCNAETGWLVESLCTAAAEANENGDPFKLKLVSCPGVFPTPQQRLVGRYRPQDAPLLPSAEDFDRLAGALTDGLQLLDATRRLRPEFVKLVESNPRLQLVTQSDWPGLGAVLYKGQAVDLQAVNRAIYDSLKVQDSGFTWGEVLPSNSEATETAGAEQPMGCIRFGLVPPDTDIQGMIDHLIKVGAECDSKVVADETLVATIRRGIETVEKNLADEERERLEREGALRQVPFVDTLLNWWSPLPPRRPLPGTALSLSNGQLMSTELTYQYKAQFCPAEN
ncbi:hypothetical protein BOX15_Mlig000227g1, partial [Macrostomum lignano]